jgi:hypothetical protein
MKVLAVATQQCEAEDRDEFRENTIDSSLMPKGLWVIVIRLKPPELLEALEEAYPERSCKDSPLFTRTF